MGVVVGVELWRGEPIYIYIEISFLINYRVAYNTNFPCPPLLSTLERLFVYLFWFGFGISESYTSINLTFFCFPCQGFKSLSYFEHVTSCFYIILNTVKRSMCWENMQYKRVLLKFFSFHSYEQVTL